MIEIQNSVPDDNRFTDGDIWDALVANDGNMSAAARSLSRSRIWMSTRVNKSPELLNLIRSFRDEVLDIAEQNVFARVKAGDDPATEKWLLSTLGKDRGYTQGVGGAGKDGALEVVIKRISDGDHSSQ